VASSAARFVTCFCTRSYAVVAIDWRFATFQPYSQFYGDLGSADFLTEAMRTGSFDTIIHLAAVLNTASRQQLDEALRVNIGSSLALLQLAARSSPTRGNLSSGVPSAYMVPSPLPSMGRCLRNNRPRQIRSMACPNDMSNLSGKIIVSREHSSLWPYALQWRSAPVP
jgi:nucleoside-diphosphate-sugar epimerase